MRSIYDFKKCFWFLLFIGCLIISIQTGVEAAGNELKEKMGAMINKLDGLEESKKTAEIKAIIEDAKMLHKSLPDTQNDSMGGWYNKHLLLFTAICIIVFVLFAIAYYSQNRIFNTAEDKDEIAELAMRQTMGLPTGTVRGIMAISVSLVFVGAVILFEGDKVPDLVKIITSLVFGFYFAKSQDQSKALMKAMLGKTTQSALRRQEANLAIKEARRAGADKHARELLLAAEALAEKGAGVSNSSEAIAAFNNAVEKAKEATKQSEKVRLKAAEEAHQANLSQFNELKNRVRDRIDELVALNIEDRAVKALWKTAESQAMQEDFVGANQTLQKVEGIVDVLLKDFDHAKKLYEENLSPEQKEDIGSIIQKAIDNLDASASLGVGGVELTDTIFSILGALKDVDPHNKRNLIGLFKKRLAGIAFDPSDLQETVKDIVDKGQKALLENAIDAATTHMGKVLPQDLRNRLQDSTLLQKLALGGPDEMNRLFNDDFVDVVDDRSMFDEIIAKYRRTLIDNTIGDAVKKALPEKVTFDQFRKAAKSSQEDQDGKGALDSIAKVIDVGETILSFTPVGGAAKAIGLIAKGVLKIFGS